MAAGTRPQLRSVAPAVSASPGAEAALARALDAFDAGLDAPWGIPPAIAARLEAEVQGSLLRDLAAADRTALETLSVPRELSLRQARAGSLDEAEASMRYARLVLSLAVLSRGARVRAETLHHAAESYLAFRRGDRDEARSRMLAALGATDRLTAAWDDPAALAGRRAHLNHNLMRVEAAGGADDEVVRLAAGVLGELGERGVDAEAAAILAGQVAGTVAGLLPSLSRGREAAHLAALRAREEGPTHRVAAWLATKRAALADAPEPFLARATRFLGEGRGTAPVLWYSVALELLRFAARSKAPDTGGARARIAAVLAEAPEVPSSMRSG